MKRRTFLIGSASGLSVVALAACTPSHPVPTPSTASPAPSPVPRPQRMRRTSWSTDAFAHGSVSFTAVGSTPEHRSDLGAPVLNRLFFAGEATSTDAPGTVQGAQDSGLRAAREVDGVAKAGERVAVVGAGIAGVWAARQLRQAGYSVVVIEARDRVGGRIQTVTDSGWPFPIELGSSLARDTGGGSVVDELTALGIATSAFPPDPETRSGDGQVVKVPATGADDVARALDWAAKQPRDVSVARALAGAGIADASSASAAAALTDVDWLNHYLATEFELASGATPGQLSAWYSPAVDGAADRIVLGGYTKLVESAAVDVGLQKSSVVTRIAYTDQGVSLRLGTGESLKADRVIVTVPLGVLKTDALEFAPPLPFGHRTAIAALGMGVLDKVWLQFKKPFWSTDAPLWATVGGDPDFPAWINMQPLTGEPVLLGLTAAKNAVRLGALNDRQYLAAALASLVPFAKTGR